MNPGGEPERDETGLPPVDIEIPDDARDLDRDVQAYYRERRALRRQQRRSRWHRSLGRDGVVLPLLACCLILALITGTLLTVFTATSNQSLNGGPATSGNGSAGASGSHAGPAASGSHPLPVLVARQLPPGAMLALYGGTPLQASTFKPGMLILVPAHCSCAHTLSWLAEVASNAHAVAYLVYTSKTKAEVEQLDGQLSAAGQEDLILARETDGGILSRPENLPAGTTPGTLTSILIAPNGLTTYASHLAPTDNPASLVRAITF